MTEQADDQVELIDYYKHGEIWEIDPESYFNEFSQDRDEFVAALENTDHALMVSDWEDQTLRDVVRTGPDIAFNRNQRRSIIAACQAELLERYPLRPIFGLGMGADGRQA